MPLIELKFVTTLNGESSARLRPQHANVVAAFPVQLVA